MRSIGLIAFSIMAAVCASLRAALGDTIDQSYIPPTTGQFFNTGPSFNLPIGQTFKPALNSLNFVDLYIQDAGADVGPGTSFQVKIHSSTITGTTLGTSNVVAVPDNINLGVGSFVNLVSTRFIFASPVAVTPGQTSVIEALQLAPFVSGNSNFGIDGGLIGSSTYAGGDGVVSGAIQPNFDFAFVEGTTPVPEPATIAVFGIGVAILGRRRRRTDSGARRLC